MLQVITDLPPHVIGMRATGDVSEDDYKKVAIPQVENLEKNHEPINFLFVLDTDVTNFSAAAWWQDLKLGISHYTQWHRVAIVTGQKGMEWFASLSNFFIPGKAKGFSPEELDEAIAWVSQKEESETGDFVSPPSDNDDVEAELENTSNKGQGPAGENL